MTGNLGGIFTGTTQRTLDNYSCTAELKLRNRIQPEIQTPKPQL